VSTNKKQPKIPGIVFLFFCFLAFLLNANRLHRAALGRVFRAVYILLAYNFGLARLIHLENIRTKRDAGPAAEAKILVNFNGHNNKFKILYK